jgi:hypothetical protein
MLHRLARLGAAVGIVATTLLVTAGVAHADLPEAGCAVPGSYPICWRVLHGVANPGAVVYPASSDSDRTFFFCGGTAGVGLAGALPGCAGAGHWGSSAYTGAGGPWSSFNGTVGWDFADFTGDVILFDYGQDGVDSPTNFAHPPSIPTATNLTDWSYVAGDPTVWDAVGLSYVGTSAGSSSSDPLGAADDSMWSQLNGFLDDPVMALGFGLAAVLIAMGLVLRWVRKAVHA